MQSFEAKIQKNRKPSEQFADSINRATGSFYFFLLNVIFFTFWILMNTGKLPGLKIVDPFPFILLTMMVSLEAIFLSIFVLISQNRQSTVDSMREEIHLQINQIAEKEITKALSLLADIHKAHFPKSDPDPELVKMLKNLDTSKIEANVEKEFGQEPINISQLLEKAEERIIHPRVRRLYRNNATPKA